MKPSSFIVFIVFSINLVAVDIGSDTAVTRFNTQQVVADGDRIAGFASLAAGFALANSATTGTFDCFFPVKGDIVFRFGTLELNQDLIFHNLASILSLGNIVGNFHVLELAESIDCIPSVASSACSITFADQIAAADFVYSVDWNSTGEYVAIGMENNGGNEVQIYSWNGITLTSITGVSIGNDANSVRWHPTNDWIAVGRTGGGGHEVYNYSFNGVTLTLLDSFNVGGGGATVNEVAWHPDGAHLAVANNRNNRELVIVDVNGSGVFGTQLLTNLAADANSVSWDSTGDFIAVGLDVNGGAELLVYAFTTGPLAVVLDSSAEVGVTINTVDWNKGDTNTDLIAIGLNAGADTLDIYRHATGSLTQLSPTTLVIEPTNSVHWRNDGTCLAIAVEASGDGEIRLYSFADDDLVEQDEAEIGAATNEVRWSNDGQYLASGDDSSDLTVFSTDTPNEVVLSDVLLYVNSNVTLRDITITFSGQSQIYGRGNTLTLSPTFSLLVNEGGSLLLQDVTLKGVNDSKVRGLDSRSTFSLLNAEFVLDGDYTFTEGFFDVLGDFTISGTHTFLYGSDQESVIRGARFGSNECAPRYDGSLIIDNGTTFNYAPSNNSSSLLSMESQISKIVLNGGNLHANELILTNGTFQAFGRSTINASSLTFGDGTQENNLCIDIKGAQLEVSGNLINNNV